MCVCVYLGVCVCVCVCVCLTEERRDEEQHYEQGDIEFQLVCSEQNIAKMFTKQLAAVDHHRHVDQLYK